MNIRIYLDGIEITDLCSLTATRINYDMSRRMSTATITIFGSPADEVPLYDVALYDQARYALGLAELKYVTILDGRDNATKLFEGQIFNVDVKHTDAPDRPTIYVCDMSDYATWLDRRVVWNPQIQPTYPASDKQIIDFVLTYYISQISPAGVKQVLPVVAAYDAVGKTVRQVLDDLSLLAGAEYYVDYDGVLWYDVAGNAPAAPFDLSTDPDHTTSFPVRVDAYSRDFQNPINSAYVRGALTIAGLPISAQFTDPVSVKQYGIFQTQIIDEQITDPLDAELRAKTLVLQYAYPVPKGSFTIWKDGLKVGQTVKIEDPALELKGTYIIRSLSMSWKDKTTVEYKADFGAAQPDLETFLRMIVARQKWKTGKPQAGLPLNGSVSDDSIVPGGISGDVIGSINADQIVGLIEADQIGSVNAGVIAGEIAADQIGSVNAAAIQGTITADQIGSVEADTIQGSLEADQIGSINASVIQGVIVTDQLADQIIDDLAKFATPLRPVPMLSSAPPLPHPNYLPGTFIYNTTTGHFYRVDGAGTAWVLDDNPEGTLQPFYQVGAISADSIVGLIVAGQIGSINADQIVGQIRSDQIQSITAAQITGSIQANQIAGVNASTIIGTINATQIATVNASAIQGAIQAAQIGTINAATITIGTMQDSQIGDINGGKIWAGTITSAKLYSAFIEVGGGGGKPGVLNVTDGSGAIVARAGLLTGGDYGIWGKVLGAGGTSYTDAKLKTDIAGNLTISDANITITNPNTATQFTTGPARYDGSYSSIALGIFQSSGTGDRTEIVTRGVVVFYGGSAGSNQVASINRSPSQTNAGEVTVRNAGVLKIHLDGVSGIVKSTSGYWNNGSTVIDSSNRWVGNGVLCPDYGVAASGFNPKVGGVQYFGTGSQDFYDRDGKLIRIRGGVCTS